MFTALWRLTSPKIYSWQVGDPGELMIYFQSESKDLITRNADGEVLVQRQEKPNAIAQRQAGGIPLFGGKFSLFFLLKPPTDWIRPTHNLCSSVCHLNVKLIEKPPHKNTHNSI